MDDGGRCLLDVINDPLLLQSFLESDNEGISKDHQSGGSMTVASSTVLIGCDHVTTSGQLSSSASLFSASGLKTSVESMGFNCQPGDKQNLMGHITLSAGNNSPLVVSPATSSIHLHTLTPTFVNSVRHHLSVPRTALTIVSNAATSSPVPHFTTTAKLQAQGSIAVQSMPPPSPLQQQQQQPTRSQLSSHTPPIPIWTPTQTGPQLHTLVRAPTPTSVSLSHAAVSHSTTSVMSPTTGNVIIPTSVAQKLQAQQVVYHHSNQTPTLVPLTLQQHANASQQAHLAHATQQAQLSQVVTSTTSSVTSVSPVVQFISTPHQNAGMQLQNIQRTVHHVTRPIQPKQPQQILPKPPNNNNTVKQPVVTASPTPSPQPRAPTVGVNLNPNANNQTPQMMISQNSPSVFTGPQGTIVFNHVLPGMGQTPLLIQGNIGNLQGMQFTLRPQHPTAFTTGSPNATHTLPHNGAQNNALLAALQASSQQSQAIIGGAKQATLQGQHTIMIPSSLAAASGLTGQNINLAASQVLHPAHAAATGILASRPNIILAPRVLGPHQGFHLHQIQTAQGPMTIALAPGQTLTLPQMQSALHNTNLAASGQVSMSNAVTGQSFFPGISIQQQATHQAIPTQQLFNQQTVHQNLITGPMVTFQKAQEQPLLNIQQPQTPIRRTSTPLSQVTVPIAMPQPPQPQHQLVETENKDSEHCANSGNQARCFVVPVPEPPKPAKSQGVNLAELLKEHGIMEEGTPPASPNSNQNTSPDVPQSSEYESSKMPTMQECIQSNPVTLNMPMANQSIPVQISQASESPHPQLKFSMTHDGSIILQPPLVPALNVPHQSSLPSKVISDSVTPKARKDHTVTSSKMSKNHTALLARLNSGPAVAVPTIKSSSLDAADGRVPLPLSMVDLAKNTIISSSSSVIPISLQTVSASNFTHNPSILTAAVSKHSMSTSTNFPVVSKAAMIPVSSGTVVNSKTPYNCFNHVIVGLPQPSCNPNPPNISQAVTNCGGSIATNFRSVAVGKNSNVTTFMNVVNSSISTSATTTVVSNADATRSTFVDHKQRTHVVDSTVQVQKHGHLGNNSHHQIQMQSSSSKPIVPKIEKASQHPIAAAEPQPSTSNNSTKNSYTPTVMNVQPLKGNSICSTIPRATMFRHQLIADQDAAVKAFSRRPFSSRDDAIRRLLAFHVYHTPKSTDDDFHKADEIFEILSEQLLERRQKIFDKYKTLVLKDSMKSYPTVEKVLVDKLFLEGETSNLASDKRSAMEGKELSVPLLDTSFPSFTKASTSQESDCDDFSTLNNPTDHKGFKTELKTLQLRLHRSLKRDRANSPIEEDLNVESASSKKSCSKIYKSTKIERKSPTSELLTSNSAKYEQRFLSRDNHRENMLRPIENPNMILQHNNNNSCHIIEEDLMSKIRKELNLSPIDHDDHNSDFESATAAAIADFELPVARTEASNSNPPSVLSFTSDARARNEVSYDFGVMDSSSEWTEAYAEQDKKLFLESEAAVESILNSEDEEGGTPELGLSDIEDLDLVRTEHTEQSFRRGAKEAIAAAEHSLANSKRLPIFGNGDLTDGLHNDSSDLTLHTQVQSAIKSILNNPNYENRFHPSENRSYTADGELAAQVLNFNRRISRDVESDDQGPFSMENVSIDYDDYNDDDDELEERVCSAGANGSVGSAYADGSNPEESDAALDEAVRSILL